MANEGKKFEADIKESAIKQGVWILRLNDTSLSWQQERTARFTPQNPCDFIIYRYPYLFMLELKSTGGKTIGIQPLPTDPQNMIKAHQISALTNANLINGIFCGFILNYRNEIYDDKEPSTYWLSIDNFNQFLVDLNRKSIGEMHVAQYDGIVIEQHKKRTRYTYDINKMLDDIVEKGKGGTCGSTTI